MSRIIIELERDELRLLVEEAVQNVIEKSNIKEEPVADVPEILNVEQVCRLLTMKKSTLYQKTHKSEIFFSKKGKALYFSRKDILEWLAKGRNLKQEEQFAAADALLIQANKKRMNHLKKKAYET